MSVLGGRQKGEGRRRQKWTEAREKEGKDLDERGNWISISDVGASPILGFSRRINE